MQNSELQEKENPPKKENSPTKEDTIEKELKFTIKLPKFFYFNKIKLISIHLNKDR